MAIDSCTDRGWRPKTIRAMTPWTPITDRPGPRATMRPPTKHHTTSVPRCSQSDPAVRPATTAENESPTASETMADGARRAEIKHAEGIRQATILKAEGEAQAIKLVNEAADKYFVGNAQLLRRLIAVETSLSANAKIVVPSGTELVNVIGDLAGILPLKRPEMSKP